jgi:hypothetical protein
VVVVGTFRVGKEVWKRKVPGEGRREIEILEDDLHNTLLSLNA